MQSNEGFTPLILAAYKGHEAVCRLLIANKALVETKTNDGITPLLYAAGRGHEVVCELLIANKASVEIKTNDGVTPLMCAAQYGSVAVCKLLIDVLLEPARKNKAAIVTFLGIVRKRGENFPCRMHYDVAKIIARQAFQLAMCPVIEQINR